MTEAWPWIALAGLGAFHGLNPAMGWLFAAALGMHRQSRGAVLLALVPISAGHFLSVAVVAGAFVATGLLIPMDILRRAAGLALIGWAAYHAVYGHRGRVARLGMQAGLLGLLAWSFLMATAHGAGLMLFPALMEICFSRPADMVPALTPAHAAIIGILVHSAAMLIVTGVVAIVVYDWVGLAMLRHAWINFDLLWWMALAATGAILLAI